MCRHETATYACGHKEDIGFFCDRAQSYGPLFNKVNCPNYSHGAEKIELFKQCGKQGGFYCARSQDGVVIDRAKGAQNAANAQLNIKITEFQPIALQCSNYLQEAKTRGISAEELAKVPSYCELEQRRQLIGSQCTVLRNRSIFFNNLLNHAFSRREMLAPGVCHHPEWDLVSFDFVHSIFTPDLLQPIRHLLPGQGLLPMTPAGPHLQITMNQHQNHSQSINNEMLTSPDPQAPPAPQANSTQRPKLKVTITPKKQITVTAAGSPLSSEPIRGSTPEGEDMMSRAARYRAQMTGSSQKVVSGSMTKAGYDVETYGIRPPVRGKPWSHNLQKNDSSPAAIDNSNSLPAPKKPRRSARTQNTKPKYAEGSDNSLGSDAASPYKPDSVWNDSPGKSDAAWVETPTKAAASSSSPIRPTRARNNRTTQRLTGSPNGSPTQASLRSRISDYQGRTENVTLTGTTHATAAASQSGNPFQTRAKTSQAATQVPHVDSSQVPPADYMYNQNVQMSPGPRGINQHGQDDSVSGGFSSNMAYAQGMLQSSHTPQQRMAAMQRGSNLIQKFGQSLQQHHIASRMVDTAAVDATQSPHTQQQASSPSARFASQAQMANAMPQLGSPSADSSNNGSPASPMNFSHHNLNQARADGATLPSQSRAFSIGSMPLSTLANQPFVGSPLSSSNHEFYQPTPIRCDYDNMRRSFSSTANLTPQHSLLSPHPASGPEPLKRSLPPASPTMCRKRQRLSFPGEDNAPLLTPSQSKHQRYAPAGLPAVATIDFAAEIAAIEMFEKQNMADLAALSASPSTIDQGLHSQHEFWNSATALPDTGLQADQSIPIDPQLYGDPSASIIGQSTEESPIDPGVQMAGQSSTQLPQTGATSTQGILDDSSSPLSEPDWSLLLNDDAF